MSQAPTIAEAPAPPAVGYDGRFALAGSSLREHAARGTLINGAFLIGLSALGLARGFVLALFISTRDYGVWGILVVSLATLLWLKQVGIGDKYIQQSDPDQELAFQRAFTLEAMFTGAFALLLLAALPLIALVYGRTEVIAPGAALVLVLPAVVLQTPLWVFYRQMRFARQRALQAVDPLVGFVVAVALAVAGAGYWSLVAATLAGAWAAALVALRASPFRLRLRYDPGTLRGYASFSWPLLAAGASGLVIAQGSVLAGGRHLGLAAAGALTLASSITLFANGVDQVITGTLYPAICAVAQRTELLFESFVKSNRLALMWAVPFGVGLALFAPDLVDFVIGRRWAQATVLLQAFGLMAALNHIGFNWDAYFRARGDTRPIGVTALATMAAFLLVALPLLLIDGLDGLAVGIGVQTLVNLALRTFYLRRLFVGFRLLGHAARAVAPAAIAAAPVLVARALEPGGRNWPLALGELAGYALLTVAAAWALEGELLREALGYVRGGDRQAP